MKRQLLMFILLFILPTILLTQEINWQQEFQGYLNDQLTYAYSGGFDYGRPALVDIDNDKDLDLFVGEREGGIDFIRNAGTALEPKWRLESKNYFNFIFDDNYYAPAFCDIDADGDPDAFIGSHIGKIIFMQNDGTPANPVWTKITDEFMQIDVGYHSLPTLCDLDKDGDFDLTIGASDSVIIYLNNGDPKKFKFVRSSARYDETSPKICYVDFDG
ncbi:VCBS repeat-containing protein, partial [candidate division KSB1 bacterium]|nr:VCBS repeat-containing protein [candidate division KSB1 bacterium]